MTIPIEVTLPDDGAPQAAVGDVTDTALTELETVEADLPEVVAPDRADAPVSEITERFLKVVLAHVPLDRIEELHLFSPLRQGGVETGIAVIAARVRLVVVEQPSAPELPLETEVLEAAAVVEGVADEPAAAEAMMAEVDAVDAEVEAEVEVDAEVDAEVEAGVDAEDLHADDVTVIETMPVPRLRHTVYTARYRLVQKGPERGKWEADVVAEAEAPLITVDLVVRGVQRRAGEESEIVRYSAPQLARAVRVPYPTV
jgi:hypothetical protein